MNEQSQKLVGAGTTGDVVLNNQALATDDGFKNVSKIWYDKTLSFDAALEKLDAERETQEDKLINGKTFAPYYDEGTNEVGMEDWGAEKKYKLTPHAWRQFSSHVDLCHTYVNQALQGEVLKSNGEAKYSKDAGDVQEFFNVMKNRQRRIDKNRKFLIRTYNDNVCRAVLTPSYKPIDNRWMIETLSKILPGGRVSHWDKCNADTLGFNVLIPDSIRSEDDSDYGGMVSVTNCEIGTRRNSGYPSLFRAICMNGCIWDQVSGTSWSQVHKGKIDMSKMGKIMLECINNQIPLIDTLVTDFMATREWEFGATKPQQLLACFAKENSLGKSQLADLFQGFALEKHNQNGFGFINAVTRFSQSQSTDVWQSYDNLAGRMVDGGKGKWDAFVERAKSYDDKDLEKIFNKRELVHSNFNLISA